MKIHFKTPDEIQKNNALKKNTLQKKASYFLGFSVFILIFDLFTYAVALLMDLFDFGIFFEILSLVFAILAILRCNKGNFKSTKTCILISSIPIFMLASFDSLETIVNMDVYLNRFLTGYITLTDLLALTLFLILFFNYLAYSCMKKIEIQQVAEEELNKNWFYEEN